MPPPPYGTTTMAAFGLPRMLLSNQRGTAKPRKNSRTYDRALAKLERQSVENDPSIRPNFNVLFHVHYAISARLTSGEIWPLNNFRATEIAGVFVYGNPFLLQNLGFYDY
jgi:hypothetical protein